MFPVKSANYPTKNTTREGFGSPGQRKTGNEKQHREPSPTTLTYYTYYTYFTVHLAESGKIYFLTTITEPDDLDNPDNWPEGYDPTYDYLCIDSLNYEPDPNIHLHNSSNCWAEPKMLAITKEIEEYGNIHTNPNYGWGREAYEMVGEWQSHNNVIFSFSKQAKHVDFDRNEKNKGFGYFLLKAFKRALGIM